jgi:hypothetical protein
MSNGPHKNQAQSKGRVDKAPGAGHSGIDAKAIENDANDSAAPPVLDAVRSTDSSIPESHAELPDSPDPVDLCELLNKEKEAIKKSREGIYFEKKKIKRGRTRIYKVRLSTNLTGLSLSGGGIRSACFNLGLLEGLDRLECNDALAEKLKPTADTGGRHNNLELFDYVSSVSGGSYAAGHLATAMLSPNTGMRTDSGAKFDTPEWLGKVPLTSKTVPGWLWGVGVWFLGVAFQLLKTGSLLLCSLALLAFVMRTLDSRDAIRLCEVYGLDTDVERGFIPFWFALGIFLVGYWIKALKQRKWLVRLWFGSALVLLLVYVVIIMLSLWSHDHLWLRDNFLFYRSFKDPRVDELSPLSFRIQYFFLMVFPGITAAVCLAMITGQALTWLWHRLVRALRLDGRFEGFLGRVGGQAQQDQTVSWVTTEPAQLRRFLLVPVLVALFCLAGLVTTGDIGLTSNEDGAAKLSASQQRSRELAETTNFIYRTALSLLGLTSLVFLFPRNLFKSARKVEDRASGRAEAPSAVLKRWGLEPVFRVVVFLCSYGFVLLVIFVLYSTVAGENVSGYYEWRDDLPFATFHQDDFKNQSQAWELIALDAAKVPDSGPPDLSALPTGWEPLATRLMAVRKKHFHYDEGRVCGDEVRKWETEEEFSLEQDRADATALRAWSSLPWIVRLFPWFVQFGPKTPWSQAGFDIEGDVWRPYALNAAQFRTGERLASRIAGAVLSDPYLYLDVPDAPPEAAPSEQESERDPDLKERYLARVKSFATYRARAKSLATLDSTNPMIQAEKPAIQAAIRNNNRRALQLYLPDYVRDRNDKVIFASIVWAEDQWTRLRIVLIAGAIWILCCAVDVNSFSLQKFYRGHVIDSWVKIPAGKNAKRWLHQTMNTYRGHEFGMQPHRAMERRAPLLLINATLEGNRSLGDEPDLSRHIFTFSRIASGSGATRHWLNGIDGRRSLARRSHLDIGNIVATSGAFLSPGTIANPALSAILHLLNIQTGYWAQDPTTFDIRSPKESLLFHISQSLGVDCEGDSRFMLTDGAHVENLGLYVLLQRRCSLIVASDCSQEDHSDDAHRRFDALIHVLQQAHVDGIEVSPFFNSRGYRHWLKTGDIPKDGGDFGKDCHHNKSVGLDLLLPHGPPPSEPSSPWSAIASAIAVAWPPNRSASEPSPRPEGATSPAHMNGAPPDHTDVDAVNARAAFAQEHYLFAQIVYPDKSRGLLVYLRPTLTGDEGDSLLHGAAGTRFPDDDPMDQFYTPAKMNTYRLLGRHAATELMHDPVMIDAFTRIAQGQLAGKSPDHNLEDSAKEECATQCKKIGLSACVGGRQRIFRPTVRPVPTMSRKDCEVLKELMPGLDG